MFRQARATKITPREKLTDKIFYKQKFPELRYTAGASPGKKSPVVFPPPLLLDRK